MGRGKKHAFGRSLAIASVAVLAVPALAATPAIATSAVEAAKPSAAPNNDPKFLQVYDSNVENLETDKEKNCPGDWHDLLYLMKRQPLRPDVFIVQQLSGKAQLDTLLKRMKEHLGEEYDGMLAEDAPAQAKGSVCKEEKWYQTNAVVWRKNRIAKVNSPANGTEARKWQAEVWRNNKCVGNGQPRTKGVKALLTDKISKKTITAASFHWPTKKRGGEGCSARNASELVKELTEDGHGAADLFLAGGDSNHEASTSNDNKNWTPWYAKTNGDLKGSYGFRDAVYRACAGAGNPGTCLADKWTLQGKKAKYRIDFVLGKKKDGSMPEMTNTVVPTFNDGDAADLYYTNADRQDLDYSDHKAVGTRVHY